MRFFDLGRSILSKSLIPKEQPGKFCKGVKELHSGEPAKEELPPASIQHILSKTLPLQDLSFTIDLPIKAIPKNLLGK